MTFSAVFVSSVRGFRLRANPRFTTDTVMLEIFVDNDKPRQLQQAHRIVKWDIAKGF